MTTALNLYILSLSYFNQYYPSPHKAIFQFCYGQSDLTYLVKIPKTKPSAPASFSLSKSSTMMSNSSWEYRKSPPLGRIITNTGTEMCDLTTFNKPSNIMLQTDVVRYHWLLMKLKTSLNLVPRVLEWQGPWVRGWTSLTDTWC